MSENKTQRTDVPVESFLETISEKRQKEAQELISIMQEISGQKPYMFGSSIIGFDEMDYETSTGRKGTIPKLAFSPRKSAITLYFDYGFDEKFEAERKNLGKHRTSVACLYINKLQDVDMTVLRKMLEDLWEDVKNA